MSTPQDTAPADTARAEAPLICPSTEFLRTKAQEKDATADVMERRVAALRGHADDLHALGEITPDLDDALSAAIALFGVEATVSRIQAQHLTSAVEKLDKHATVIHAVNERLSEVAQ